MKHVITLVTFVILTAVAAFAQSESAYDPSPASPNGETASPGLLDPSRFTVNHAMSFMAGGTRKSDIKSQSMYSTMVQYKFNAPVTLGLNFDMPIHSTFNQYNNFTRENLESMDYFRNMPIDASISWQPTESFMMRVSVIKMPESGYYYSPFGRSPFYRGW